MTPLSPLRDDEQPLTDEAEYLVAQLRWHLTSDDEAIALTLENYPALSQDEIRSWWRVGAFRRAVKEAREVAKGYAREDAGEGSGPMIRDACAVPAAEAFASPAGERSSWWGRWVWPGE
jgi:hypothetical protein